MENDSVDEQAQTQRDAYTDYKDKMFDKTNTIQAPWTIVDANKKTQAHLDAINILLKHCPINNRELGIFNLQR